MTGRSLLPPERPTATAYGAFVLWPEDLAFSNQVTRLIGYVGVGGADFSEIYAVARDLPVGDRSAWRAGFAALAQRLERQARVAAERGQRLTARQLWLRASTYFRSAGQFAAFAGGDVPYIDESRACFAQAADADDLRIEAVDVPLDGQAMAGYLVRPPTAAGESARPAVIVSGGIDAFAEEMHLKIGEALARRGFVVLLLDGPGQGESARRGVIGRPDYESACANAVDFLQARTDVDPERIAMLGQSLGGYNATRAAGFEPRLAACVVWGAAGNFYADVGRHVEPGSPLLDQLGQMESFFGVEGVEAVQGGLLAMDLTGVPEQIACPTLVLHGQDDIQIPVAAAQWTHDHIAPQLSRLIIYPSGEPGCTHCQLDSPLTAQRDICDFLETQLG